MKKHLRTLTGNDANYDVKGCPFYSRWVGMLKRCYSEDSLRRDPCYQGVKVCEEWKNSFLSFRQWMEAQEWEGNQLDKDLKGDGTLYSPETCLFIPSWVNALFPKEGESNLPLGVSMDHGRYRATISTYNQQKFLGNYSTAEEAHSAYVHEKMYYICERGATTKLLPLLAEKFKEKHLGKYVYIAGGMRGIPEFNFPAFNSAEIDLASKGHIVFNPAKRDSRSGFNTQGMSGHEDLSREGFPLREALWADTQWICLFADAIYLLPGWEKSTGALAERALGEALGLEIVEYGTARRFTEKLRDILQRLACFAFEASHT